MAWDPETYLRYADERARPFHELLARVRCERPRRVVDLGCGPGTLTASLAGRWPDAQIHGLDQSAEMIADARALQTERLRFDVADIGRWQPRPEDDVVVSNAALHWVPDHVDLLGRWATVLARGAWLAFQVPANFDAPSHALMRRVASSDRWRGLLGGVLRHSDVVSSPARYADLLMASGLRVDAWQTTYIHVLPGADPVLAWVRGTALRPVLDVLTADQAAAFEADYGALLREAYPATPSGTLLPFTRTFVVAQRLD